MRCILWDTQDTLSAAARIVWPDSDNNGRLNPMYVLCFDVKQKDEKVSCKRLEGRWNGIGRQVLFEQITLR
jgi:hypothetical protein